VVLLFRQALGRCAVVFRIYNRALTHEEIWLMYKGRRVADPVARGIALVEHHPDGMRIRAIMVSRL